MPSKKLVRVPRRGKDLWHTVLPDGSTVVFKAKDRAEALKRQGEIARRLNA